MSPHRHYIMPTRRHDVVAAMPQADCSMLSRKGRLCDKASPDLARNRWHILRLDHRRPIVSSISSAERNYLSRFCPGRRLAGAGLEPNHRCRLIREPAGGQTSQIFNVARWNREFERQ